MPPLAAALAAALPARAQVQSALDRDAGLPRRPLSSRPRARPRPRSPPRLGVNPAGVGFVPHLAAAGVPRAGRHARLESGRDLRRRRRGPARHRVRHAVGPPRRGRRAALPEDHARPRDHRHSELLGGVRLEPLGLVRRRARSGSELGRGAHAAPDALAERRSGDARPGRPTVRRAAPRALRSRRRDSPLEGRPHALARSPRRRRPARRAPRDSPRGGRRRRAPLGRRPHGAAAGPAARGAPDRRCAGRSGRPLVERPARRLDRRRGPGARWHGMDGGRATLGRALPLRGQRPRSPGGRRRARARASPDVPLLHLRRA